MSTRYNDTDRQWALRRKLRRARCKDNDNAASPGSSEPDVCPLSRVEIARRLGTTRGRLAIGGVSLDPMLRDMVSVMESQIQASAIFTRVTPSGELRRVEVAQIELLHCTTVHETNEMLARKIVSLYDEPHKDDGAEGELTTREDVEAVAGMKITDEAWGGKRWDKLKATLLSKPDSRSVRNLVKAIRGGASDVARQAGIEDLARYLNDFACWSSCMRSSKHNGDLILDLTRWWPTHEEDWFLSCREAIQVCHPMVGQVVVTESIMRLWDETLTRSFKRVTHAYCINELIRCSVDSGALTAMTVEDAEARLDIVRKK